MNSSRGASARGRAPAGVATEPLGDAEVSLLLEVLQQAKLAVWAADNSDADFAIRLWTQGAQRIYGFRNTEAIGRNYLSLFVNPQERAKAIEDHQRTIETGKEFGWNFAADDVTKDGTVRTILGNSFRVWDPHRERYIVAEVGIDISDFDDLSRQVEQMRQMTVLQGDTRHQMKILRGLNALNEAIATLNRPDDGGLERVVRSMREGVHAMLSGEPLCRVWLFDDAETPRLAPGSDELPGTPAFPETNLILTRDSMSTPLTIVADGERLVDDGGDGFRSAIVAPLRFGTDLRGALIMFFRAESPMPEPDQELIPHFSSYAAVALVMASLAREQQRRRHEETERIRHAIIQSVLHTVGNEAGLAKLAVDSLNDELVGVEGITGKARRRLEQIQASADRLGQVMGELIRLNVNIDEPAMLNLCESVRIVTRIVERDYYDKIVLEHRIDPSVSVEASEYLLREALGNLVRNAVQAMIEADGGGDLRISAYPIVREWDGKPRHIVCLDVEDSGPGVQPEFRQRVWEFGFTTRGEGHGHGLFHTRGLVGMFGGAVELLEGASELGGAHFRMLLPAGRVAD
ncbi:hypothetical protein GCM10022225_25540 [Plantactinospora mayteni]|uniref:histidine kinase n=1 Tax=Plantactinospora mayteni TaxID=566021 RepID=A0ABQ4EJ08_9ACTN|nr:PAS domain-containing sensor histidine kinase [Plantactinospora mayteni]GIG94716.1 hypothetical protein Pma05_12890 [Plantactinospora mayteni]